MIAQVYEIQSPKEAERCIEAGVDHIGSVLLSEADWKQPDIRETIRVSDGTPVKNSVIPLFNVFETLCKALDYYRPDFIHFCETLTDDRGVEVELDEVIQTQLAIKEKFPEVRVMRSIPIPVLGSEIEFPTLYIAGKLEPVSDLFLTDTWLGKEPVEGFIGITGKRCDWNVAGDLVRQSGIPVILAGGLSPENVYDAVMTAGSAGADSCTRTNEVDIDGKPVRFKKDFDRVKRFVKEVRRAEKDFRSKISSVA